MTITYGTQKLKELFTEIKNGVVTIPSFQRGFAWSARDIVRIYNSVIHKNEPFGSIVVWNDTANSKTIPNESKIFNQLNIKVSDSQKTYLIDGQQRVTSFLMSYIWFIKPKATHISKIKKIKYDLNNKTFVLKEKMDKTCISPFFFNVEKEEEIINKVNDVLKEYSTSLSREQERNLLSTYRSFQGIDIGTIRINSSDLNEVIDVFTLINTKGKKLSPFNIVHAQYISKGNGFNLTAEYDKILRSRGEKWEIPHSVMLILHYTLLHNTISNKEILDKSSDGNLVKKDIDFIKNDLKKIFQYTIDELEDLGYISYDFLPTDKFLFLVGKVIYWRNNNLSTIDLQIIKKWFKSASINERYNSGGEGAKVNGFKEDWKSLKKNAGKWEIWRSKMK